MNVILISTSWMNEEYQLKKYTNQYNISIGFQRIFYKCFLKILATLKYYSKPSVEELLLQIHLLRIELLV